MNEASTHFIWGGSMPSRPCRHLAWSRDGDATPDLYDGWGGNGGGRGGFGPRARVLIGGEMENPGCELSPLCTNWDREGRWHSCCASECNLDLGLGMLLCGE